MVDAINQLLPGRDRRRAGPDPRSTTIEDYAGRGRAASVWSVLLYAGLGWLSGMRQALEVMFVVPRAGAAELRGRQAARPRARWR